MKRFRFLRALIGVGTTWGVAWAAAMAVLAVALWLTLLRHYATLTHLSLPTFVIREAIYGFGLGATAGMVFSCVLAVLEKRRTFGTLSMWRVASWGGFAGVVLLTLVMALRSSSLTPAPIVELAIVTVVVGGLGAVSAVATLSAARRGRLQSGEDAARLTAT
jgi:hypothetical protein